MVFGDRKYVIFGITELDQIDFDQVLETSAETVRRSVDGTKTFVKYEGDQPTSVVALESKSPEYSHEEILEILSGPEWTVPNIEI